MCLRAIATFKSNTFITIPKILYNQGLEVEILEPGVCIIVIYSWNVYSD